LPSSHGWVGEGVPYLHSPRHHAGS
jgi:hypothetical protein